MKRCAAMNRYVVTRTEIFMMIVHAESKEDAESISRTKPEFDFIDEEYSVE